MIQLHNGIIQVCNRKIKGTKTLPARKGTETRTIHQAFYCKEQELEDFADLLQQQGYETEAEPIDTEGEAFLDGAYCQSIDLAEKWLSHGEAFEPLNLEALAEVVADIIGGAIL